MIEGVRGPHELKISGIHRRRAIKKKADAYQRESSVLPVMSADWGSLLLMSAFVIALLYVCNCIIDAGGGLDHDS